MDNRKICVLLVHLFFLFLVFWLSVLFRQTNDWMMHRFLMLAVVLLIVRHGHSQWTRLMRDSQQQNVIPPILHQNIHEEHSTPSNRWPKYQIWTSWHHTPSKNVLIYCHTIKFFIWLMGLAHNSREIFSLTSIYVLTVFKAAGPIAWSV